MDEIKQIDKQLNKCIRTARRKRKKWLCNEMKLLKFCVKRMDRIGFPKDKDDKDELRELINLFDRRIALLEKDFISKKREHVQ